MVLVEHSKADQDKAKLLQSSLCLLKEIGTNSKEELRTLMRDRDIEGVIWHRSDLVPT